MANPTLSQHNKAVSGSSATTFSVTLPSAPSVGDIVVLGISAWTGGTVTVNSVKDQGNNSLSSLGVDAVTNNSNALLYAYTVPSGLTGTYTVTVTFAASTFCGLFIQDWTPNGLTTTENPASASSAGSSGCAAGATDSLSITSTQTDFFFACLAGAGGATTDTWTAGGELAAMSDYEPDGSSFQSGGMAYGPASASAAAAAGTYTLSITFTTSALAGNGMVGAGLQVSSGVNHNASITWAARGGAVMTKGLGKSLTATDHQSEVMTKGLGKNVIIADLSSEIMAKGLGKPWLNKTLDTTVDTRQAAYGRNLTSTESTGATDARQVAYGRAIVSQDTWAGAVARSVAYARSIISSPIATAVLVRSVAYGRSIIAPTLPGATVFRLVAYGRQILVNEAITQSMIGLKTKIVNITTSIRRTEMLTRAVAYSRSITSTAARTETFARLGAYSRALSWLSSRTETVTGSASHSGTNFNRSITSTILPFISTTRQAAYGRVIQIADLPVSALNRSVSYGRSLVSQIPVAQVTSATKTKLVSITIAISRSVVMSKTAAYGRSITQSLEPVSVVARLPYSTTRGIVSIVRHFLSLVGIHQTPTPDAIFTAQVRSKSFKAEVRSLTMTAQTRSKTFTARKQP